MPAANPMALKRSERNGPCTAVDFVKPQDGPLRRAVFSQAFFSNRPISPLAASKADGPREGVR